MDDLAKRLCVAGALILMLVVSRLLVAQDTADDTKNTKPTPQPFIEDARKYVIQSTRDAVKLHLLEKSLFNWTNPVRQQERGAIYVWLQDGRPLVIGSLFTYEINTEQGL